MLCLIPHLQPRELVAPMGRLAQIDLINLSIGYRLQMYLHIAVTMVQLPLGLTMFYAVMI